jgi:predicted NAD/FAD-dependent oxidoreductase
MTEHNDPTKVLIIGAGLSGLMAANILITASTPERSFEVLVVDKGRSVGGRLATRRIGAATLDHGAQFFTVRSAPFQAAVDQWCQAGVVEEWCRGFDDPADGYPRYRVNGGMNALAKHLAQAVDGDTASAVGGEPGTGRIVTRQRAEAIIPGPDRWAVTYEAAKREPDEADAVIATAPVPQFLDLLAAGATIVDPAMADELRAITYHKVIAIMTLLDRSPELAGPGALQQPDNPVFTFVADNQAKGISQEPAVTFHLAHALSDRLWDEDDEAVLAAVGDDMSRLLGSSEAVQTQVKRWRYAGPVSPRDERSLVVAERPGPLIVAGDAFGGSKVEGAFLSGLAAAERLLAAPQ